MEGVARNGKIHKAVVVNGRLIPACGLKQPGQTELNKLSVALMREVHGHSMDCKKCFPQK